MRALEYPKGVMSYKARMQLAQKAYQFYMGKFFWRLNESLKITDENLPRLLECIELYGCMDGWLVAQKIRGRW